MADDQKSLTWIVLMVMTGIAVVGWGVLAGSYAGAHSPKLSEMSAGELEDINSPSRRSSRRAAVAVFVRNALEHLPNLPAVVSWHMTNRVWLPIAIVVLEAGALVGACALKKVESALEKPKQRRR